MRPSGHVATRPEKGDVSHSRPVDTQSRDTHRAVSLAVSTVIFAVSRTPDAGVLTLRVPLVRRIRNPYKGRWALPGGPLSPDDDLAEAARRTLHTTTTTVTPKYLEQLYTFGTVDRSPDDRVVSIVYWALVESADPLDKRDGDNVRWFNANSVPPLAFDHNAIIEHALWRVRTKLSYSRIAHAFLGETFTLAQLREVYEAILGKPLDPANFRRTVEASATVVPTNTRLAGTRHRPPRLYRSVESPHRDSIPNQGKLA